MGIELTDTQAVKSWLSAKGQAPTSTLDDDNIEACILLTSAMFLWFTGMGNADGSFPQVSPFIEPQSYNEWYDGNGHDRLFVRIFPIQTIQTLTIGFRNITQSTGYGNAGFVIANDKTSIFLRGGSGSTSFSSSWYAGNGANFGREPQSINIQYTAGYMATPPDIVTACIQQVSLTYKRRDWIGLKNKGMGANAGTTSYIEDDLDPHVKMVLWNYRRHWPAG